MPNRHTYSTLASEWESSVHLACDCGWKILTTCRAGNRAAMAAEAAEAMLEHLLKDAQHLGPVVGICDRCGRRTWNQGAIGEVCKWDAINYPCGGTFKPVEDDSAT